jgi:hypothetical protein
MPGPSQLAGALYVRGRKKNFTQVQVFPETNGMCATAGLELRHGTIDARSLTWVQKRGFRPAAPTRIASLVSAGSFVGLLSQAS